MTDDPEGTTTRLAEVADLLEAVVADRTLLAALPKEVRHRLLNAAGKVFAPDASTRRKFVREMNRRRKDERVAREEEVLQETGIRSLRRQTVFTTPNIFPGTDASQQDVDDPDFREAVTPQNCYVCKRDYTRVHQFYDQLCPECAEFNFAKRSELADLGGRVALLTGGRVKIGYQAGIKLLRSGARLIVTTRFPHDAAVRYSTEADFADWRDRLVIHGLDLRHTPSVESFCHELASKEQRLDFIINNACQTVRRPAAFYHHMMARERAAIGELPKGARTLLGAGTNGSDVTGSSASNAMATTRHTSAAELSQLALLNDDLLAGPQIFPEGQLDQDLQQVDLREHNSWRMLMAEVPAVELLEVHLVNAVAPFMINARLKPLMMASPERDKHIVNVSAVEGQFYRKFKTTRHPHTNMAKAALNMMTRTAATDYHHCGIHMNAVDTGWVTDEDPAELAERKTAEHRFHPPLDIVDGAARIVDPIIDGFNTGNHRWGEFIKDYRAVDW